MRRRAQRFLDPSSHYTGWLAPGNLSVGRGTYGRPRVVAYDPGAAPMATVGNFCSIAYGVEFLLDGGHRHDFITSSPLVALGLLPPGVNEAKGPITIGHDVWIGRGARILSGVTIGTGAVIGMGAVVASDVRPYAIAVGNPAQEIRRRFSDEEIEILLASRWWEWPDERIIAAQKELFSSDVRAFADRWVRTAPTELRPS